MNAPVNEQSRDYSITRSDGFSLLVAAWLMAVAAIGSVLLLLIINNFDAGTIGQAASWNTKAELTLVFELSTGLWATFFVTGNIVRALYFLEGPLVKIRARNNAIDGRAADNGS